MNYYLKIRWALNCLWNTQAVHRNNKNLKIALAKVYHHYRDVTERERFPKTIPFEYEGKRYFIHAYWLQHFLNAYKVDFGARLIKTAQIIGPEIAIVLLHKIAGKLCIIQLQEAVNGKPVGPWNAEMGYQLADELIKWHRINHHQLMPLRSPDRHSIAKNIIRNIEEIRSSPYLNCLETAYLQLIDRARDYLNPISMGPLALCHGDIHNGNLLRNDQGEFVWLDLDAINYSPIFQELAWIQCFILERFPDVATNLEERYFENKSKLKDQWHQCRLNWFLIQSVYYTSRLLRVGSCLPGHEPAILKDEKRITEMANRSFQKAIRAQQLIEKPHLNKTHLKDILAYLTNGCM